MTTFTSYIWVFSLPHYHWPVCCTMHEYCREKLLVNHFWELEGWGFSKVLFLLLKFILFYHGINLCYMKRHSIPFWVPHVFVLVLPILWRTFLSPLVPLYLVYSSIWLLILPVAATHFLVNQLQESGVS